MDNQITNVRLQNSATPPESCTSSIYGMIWFDTDTGLTYVCDKRDKWLSLSAMFVHGAEDQDCASGNNLSALTCTADMTQTVSTANGRNFFTPYNMTIIAYGYSSQSDTCATGSYDVAWWGSEDITDTSPTEFKVNMTSASLTGLVGNDNDLDIDVDAGSNALGVINGCGETLSDFHISVYFKWRHD